MNEHDDDMTDESPGDDREFLEIERRIAGLPLREPSAALDRRVMRELRSTSWLEKARLMGLGAAAMLALVVGAGAIVMHSRVPNLSTLPPPPQSRPIKLLETREKDDAPARPLLVRQSTSRITDDGIIGFVGSTPVQRIRQQSIQQTWVIDPLTHKHVQVTIPREQVVVKPIQTF
jgi:hypothetical protein